MNESLLYPEQSFRLVVIEPYPVSAGVPGCPWFRKKSQAFDEIIAGQVVAKNVPPLDTADHPVPQVDETYIHNMHNYTKCD